MKKEINMSENKIVKNCPVCGVEMVVKQLHCPSCKTDITGTFSTSMSNPFDEEEWKFVIEFLICEGNLKCLAERINLSYPTLKNKLMKIKQRLPGGDIIIREEVDEILDMMDKGDPEAKEMLEKMKRRIK
jgi:hypothetical protein